MEISTEKLNVTLDPEAMASLFQSGREEYILRLLEPDTCEEIALRISDSTADDIRETIRQRGPVDPPPHPSDHISDRWLCLAQSLEDEPNFRGQAATLIAWARDLITDSGDYERRRRFARMLDSMVELVKEMR